MAMHFRKGQAAMEFLMTYGWAILVVLVVIGALAYFGVLNPSKLVPDKCVASAGVSCTEYKMQAALGPTAKVVNGLGKSVIVRTVKYSSPDSSAAGCSGGVAAYIAGAAVPAAGYTWDSGAATQLTLGGTPACGYTVGNKARGTFTITYDSGDTSFQHDATVEVSSTVQ